MTDETNPANREVIEAIRDDTSCVMPEAWF